MTKSSPLGVTYEVRPDPEQKGRWVVLRGGERTGGYGNTIAMAVNSAIGLAKLEAKDTDTKVRVRSFVDGERRLEWESQ